MTDLLRVTDLEVIYRGRGRRMSKRALDGVSLTVESGQTLGLVGESGSGKSTLGNCVLGLVRPTGGTLTFDGHDITHLPVRARRAFSSQIQAVFQDPYSTFNPHRTIEQSVEETLPRSAAGSTAERRKRIVAMLQRVGLDETALRKYPAQFSGGQRQRISIARALLPEPRLVVCDESVSSLDLSVQAQVLNLLLELQRERDVAYLFITHDLAVVRHMSTRIAVLEHGRLIEEGPAERVASQPVQAYTKRLIAASPIANPIVQQARRRTRQALAKVASKQAEAPLEPASTDSELAQALEWQAVVEVVELGEAGRATTGQRLEPDASQHPWAANELDRVRAALLALSARTALSGLDADLVQRVTRVWEHNRGASDRGRIESMTAMYADVIAAAQAGRRERAMNTLIELHTGWLARDKSEENQHVPQRARASDGNNGVGGP